MIHKIVKGVRVKTAYILECSQETLINSIKEMPNLHIQIFLEATVPRLLQILQGIHNKSLTLFNLDDLSMDLNEYDKILTLVKDHHLKVVICFLDADIDVPHDILEANRNYLEINNS